MASSRSHRPQEAGTSSGSRFFFARRIWLWSIPLAWLVTALILAAEHFRLHAMPVAGDLLDIVRLAAYWFWCRLAWQRANNADNAGHAVSALLSKAALAAGFVLTVLV